MKSYSGIGCIPEGETLACGRCGSARLESLPNTDTNGEAAGHEYRCRNCGGLDADETTIRESREPIDANGQGLGRELEKADPDASWAEVAAEVDK